MTASEEKNIISDLLGEEKAEEALQAIEKYESKYPYDADLYALKVEYFLLVNDIDRAYKFSREGVARYPLNGDMQYNYAYISELCGKVYESYEAYMRAFVIWRYVKSDNLECMVPDQAADRLMNEHIQWLTQAGNEDLLLREENDLQASAGRRVDSFNLVSTAFRGTMYPQIVGGYYWENRTTKRYVGIFKDMHLGRPYDTGKNLDVLHMKAEFLKVLEGTECMIGDEAEEYMLPIATDKEATTHTFMVNESKTEAYQWFPKHFIYYRLPAKTRIESTATCYYGTPIPLKLSPNRKRLVMSIFVDGLAESILMDGGFEKYMPHTYTYFKRGAIMTRAFSASEWTYPSIATYVSGLDTTHHMLYHHTLDYPLPDDIVTLAESIREAGYYTSMYNGNWRIVPSYGHARGYDRFVYQMQNVGFKVHEVIADAINQMEAFRETDQYIWISIGDLHDVAQDEELPAQVQKNIPYMLLRKGDGGATSVKQAYDEAKVAAYLAYAKHVDRWLHILFEYIEENYADDEVVLSLFSDHGQGYLIKGENSHFLSEERSNVAMMFKGGMADGIGECDELVSAVDYGHIMRGILGIRQAACRTDGQLPKVFGGYTERNYTITESIHPGDPYQAAINTKNGTFFFTNPSPVMDDGRFQLKDYDCYMMNRNGSRIEGCKEKYLEILLKHIAPLLIYE